MRKIIDDMVLYPFFVCWLTSCGLIMKLGHGLYLLGDWMSGWHLDGSKWREKL